MFHSMFYLVQLLKLLVRRVGQLPARLHHGVEALEGVQPQLAGLDVAVGVAHLPRGGPGHHHHHRHHHHHHHH